MRSALGLLVLALVACEPDADGDGFGASVDCDDDDATVNPGAVEVCNDIDDDCDRLVDGDDPSVDPRSTRVFFEDRDLDGYGDPDSEVVSCEQPDDTVADATDCDDSDAAVYPGADEWCDEDDDDCDGQVDEPDAVDASTWYRDADVDGFGDPERSVVACDAPPGHVADATDCDDSDAVTYPGADELCDDHDQDCDDVPDDDAIEQATWYLDGDGDGWGLADETTTACDAPVGYAALPGDCDDDEAESRPDGADFPGDGVDQDCDDADATAELYVVDRYDGTLVALDAVTGETAWTEDGLGEMIGVAASGDGRLFVSRYAAGTVTEIDVGGAHTNLLHGVDHPHALWWDPSTATLLVADTGAGEVLELDPDTGATTLLATGLDEPIHAVRFPGEVEVYVTERGEADALSRVDAGGAVSTVATFEDAPSSMAPDGAGDLVVTVGGDRLVHVELATGATTTVLDGLEGAHGLCPDPLSRGLVLPGYGTGDLLIDGEAFGVTGTHPWQCASSVWADADADGFWSAGLVGGSDCDDWSDRSWPGAPTACDDHDRDCDGSVDFDGDGDGWSDEACGGSDCDDEDPDAWPGLGGTCALGSSCEALLDLGFSEDGLYAVDFDDAGDTDQVYCDMGSGGFTLLLAADGSSTTWGNNSANWKSAGTDPAPATLDGADYHGVPYADLVTDEIRLCYQDTEHCHSFDHGLGLALFEFFDGGLTYTEHSDDVYGYADTGALGEPVDYLDELGLPESTATCTWLGINETRSISAIGLLGDLNSGCASLGTATLDDLAAGVGLSSCSDANGCGIGGAGHLAGTSRNLGGVAYSGDLGPWYVFGR